MLRAIMNWLVMVHHVVGKHVVPDVSDGIKKGQIDAEDRIKRWWWWGST
jgi:hypothetical protein